MSNLGVIFGLVAAALGGSIWSFEGFLFGLILGYCLGAVIQLQDRLTKLETRLRDAMPGTDRQRTTAQETAPPPQVYKREPEPVPMPVQAERARTEALPEPELLAHINLDSEPVSTVSPPPPSSPPREDYIDKIIAKIKSFFTDGNVVVKLGVLVLFVGVGFLLKYAAAHSMLPVQLRIAAIAVGGIAMSIVGWRLRNRRQIYALLLQGGGIGVLYLTVFGAAKLYHLLPVGFAFGVMVALVVLSAILAVLQDAKYLAFYGAAGGFLAPVLASTGSGNHVMLFSYYALLNFGIVGIAWYRSWRELNLLGFLFTFVIGTLWGSRFYRPEFFASVEPFLVLYFLMFVSVSILYAFRQPPQFRGYVDSTLVFGVPIVAFALQMALVRDMDYGLAFSALALSAFYIGVSSTLWSRGPSGMRLLTEAFLAMGVVFGSLAIPLALDGRWTSAAWALEGAAIVWVGVRQRRVLARMFGLILQFGSGVFYLGDLHRSVQHWPVINGVFIGAMLVSIAGLFSSYYLYRHSEKLRSWEMFLHIPLLVWGLCWWLGAGVHEINEFITPHLLVFNIILVFITASLLLASYLQDRLAWSMLRFPVLGQLYAMIIVLWLVLVLRAPHPLAWYGWICWPFAFAVLYYTWYRNREHTGRLVQQWQHMIGFWLLLAIITWESVWATNKWIAGATWRDVMYALTPALMMLLLFTQGRKIRWPIAENISWYAGYAAGPVMIGLGLFGLGLGVMHEGNPRPITYLPVVNPVDLTVGFIVYLLILWPRILRDNAAELASLINPRPMMYAIAGGSFLWLNGIIARSVHYWFGVPHHLGALFRSTIFQASISVTWTLTAMLVMALASRRGQRKTWFIGLGLFLATVVKLFLVDIADKNELTMILSLIIVAVVAIVFGYYLSPLPPRREEKSS